ncbi:MAG TPA: hypothetical protein VJZ27_09325, partial [Aggregatilineales bacterium]|nr:hypothetical protein [Aggregatilineales bacterium]
MITIYADEHTIVVDNTHWRLFKEDHTDTPVFEYTRANNALFYEEEYGKHIGLPGGGIETSFIRAVLVGYHQRLSRWMLGLHLSESPDTKPIFREVVRWTEGDSSVSMQDAQTAARTLATILQRPLKVFGARKFPVPTADTSRSGVTGPLQPHNRERINQDDIDRRIIGITLPIRAERFVLEEHDRGLVLRVTDQGSLGDEETPLYSLCEINAQRQEV